MKKSKDFIENKKREEKEKKIKKYEIFKDSYRLNHPMYNLVHDHPPFYCGALVGFISGFVWLIIFGEENMRQVYSFCFVTGCIAGLIAKLLHKWFDEEKKNNGFGDI